MTSGPEKSDSDCFEYYTSHLGWTCGRFPALCSLQGIVHTVTTRKAPLLPARVDDPEHAGLALLQYGLQVGGLAYCRQVHGGKVMAVTTDGLVGEADGLVTATPCLGVLGRSADCPLVLAAGPTPRTKRRPGGWAVGMAHASWRSTIAGITEHMVTSMALRFDVHPGRIVAGICPSVGPCCYEVGEDVLAAAVAGRGPWVRRHFQLRERKLYLDLWSANAAQLHNAGVREENIHIARVCTVCRNDLFPSYRKEGRAAARFAAVIGIEARTVLDLTPSPGSCVFPPP